ncbi:MAG: hypothetical protein A3B68_07995 [Candidatus Melainabacteria bacterium RIFCSPHIGHO2_02_FULL_34_12]|nr:MAG: hypothetical protein A3B68_07995 [Candidatus Melainabacteria bacterium RIFCSPHIGHO2_02_FULL_34_12]
MSDLGTILTDLLPPAPLSKRTVQSSLKGEAADPANSGIKDKLNKLADNVDKFDTDTDGKISSDEVIAVLDKNSDGTIAIDEVEAFIGSLPAAAPTARRVPPRPANLPGAGTGNATPIPIQAYAEKEQTEKKGGHEGPKDAHLSTSSVVNSLAPIIFDQTTVGDSNVKMFISKFDNLHVLIYPKGAFDEKTTGIQEYIVPLSGDIGEGLENALRNKNIHLAIPNRENNKIRREGEVRFIEDDENSAPKKKFQKAILEHFLGGTTDLDPAELGKIPGTQYRGIDDDHPDGLPLKDLITAPREKLEN